MWYLRNFHGVGLGIGVVALALGVVLPLSTVQQILLLNFVLLMLHEYEEYGWPGGFPAFMNRVMIRREPTDRYPLNRINSFVVNVVAAYPLYLLPLLFPHVVWLALGAILFNVLELLIHVGGGVVVARAGYSPGLVTVLPWTAVSIWYLVFMSAHGGIGGVDWVVGVVYVLAFTVLALPVMTFLLLSNRESRYPFDEEELGRIGRYSRLIHRSMHPGH